MQILGTLNRAFWAWNWFKKDVFGKNIIIFLLKKYRWYSILRIQYSRLFHTVKTFKISAFENIDDRYSQAWFWIHSDNKKDKKKTNKTKKITVLHLTFLLDDFVLLSHILHAFYHKIKHQNIEMLGAGPRMFQLI